MTWILLIFSLLGCSLACPYGPQHTLCQYKREACPGKVLLRSGGLGCTDKQIILDAHNQLRQSVALGHVTGQPPAANMREMVWDEELAAVAQRWADQCRMGHDTERSVPRFPVGQNVAVTWTHGVQSPSGSTPDFKRQVEDWFGEVMKWGFRRNDVEHFHFSERTGHYSQLVWSDTYLVGCGYSYFQDAQRGYTKLYVCNYGPGGNVIGEHLYEPGQAICAAPDLATSRRYAGLCEVRGSNPPGIFCSAHDALHATRGAFPKSPTTNLQTTVHQAAFHTTQPSFHSNFANVHNNNIPTFHQHNNNFNQNSAFQQQSNFISRSNNQQGFQHSAFTTRQSSFQNNFIFGK